jgi:hypothetical protein
MTSEVGLKQGCPLSPILFALYISGLERKLLSAGTGIKLEQKCHTFADMMNKQVHLIPGVLFADDIVLVGRTWKDLQKALSVTSAFGDAMGLNFNPEKKCSFSILR